MKVNHISIKIMKEVTTT